MKKAYFLSLLIIFLIPFTVRAYSYDGANNYEVTKVSINGGNLVIKGWAINNPQNGKIDQTANTYRLVLEAKGFSKTYYSVNSNYVDLTCLHYNKPKEDGILNKCEKLTREGNMNAVGNLIHSTNSIWLRNVGFEFQIPLKELEDSIRSYFHIVTDEMECDEIRNLNLSLTMNLIMNINGGREVTFNAISIYGDRISGGSNNYFGNLKSTMMVTADQALIRKSANTSADILYNSKEWKEHGSKELYVSPYRMGKYKIQGKNGYATNIYGEYYWYRYFFTWNNRNGKASPSSSCTGRYCSGWIPSSFVTIDEENGPPTTLNITFGCPPSSSSCDINDIEENREPETIETGCPIDKNEYTVDDGNCLRTLVKNDYYTVQCNERAKITISDRPNVLAGEGFAYGFKSYGDRICKGTLLPKWNEDYQEVNDRMQRDADDYTEAFGKIGYAQTCPTIAPPGCDGCCTECVTYGMCLSTFYVYVKQRNDAEADFPKATKERVTLEGIKTDFEGFTITYNYSPNITLEIEEGKKTTTYKDDDFPQKVDMTNTSSNTDELYDKTTVDLAPTNKYQKRFNYQNGKLLYGKFIPTYFLQYDTWGRKVYATGEYELPQSCISKDISASVDYYKGNNTYCPSDKINSGNKYYTNFNTLSGKYKLNLFFNKLGHVKQWYFLIGCDYSITNKLKPDKGGPDGGGGDPDVNYPGGYFYRTISLYDPFLKGNSRIIGKNWKGKEYLIKPDVYNYTENQSEYIVKMTYDDVLKIKKDNNNHNIDNFNNVYLGDDNMNSSNPHKDYKSRFIHDAALGFTNLFKKSGDR